MSVLNALNARALELRKARDPLGVFLNAVVSNVAMRAKNDGNREITEDDAIAVLRKELKDNAEAQRLSASREDTMAELRAKAALLEGLLPASVGKEQVLAAAAELLGEQAKSPKAMGVLIKGLKEKFGSDLNPAEASAWVKEFLAS